MDELMADGTNATLWLPLSEATLGDMPDSVSVPSYDRAKLTPGIVHIGLGNFHRAHQAWYIHRLMQNGGAKDWAIVGAGVRAPDEAQRLRLQSQDFLYSLIELDPRGMSAEVCGSIVDFLPVENNNASLIKGMVESNIRIVSLTVTEGGYYTDPATGGFDSGHPDIIHDAVNPRRPKTAFGAMIEALRQRRATGVGPFTGLSCDNIQGNGETLRQTLVSLADMSDPDMARWIDENCSFPNSMVDCIVPATGETELELARGFGIGDAAPVTHENFRQWVVEDNFCAGRPALEACGATVTDDVHRFEAMKIRLLNGGHQVIAAAGELLGLETIADTMADPTVRAFFRKVISQEVAPHVEAVPGMTPLAYLDLIDERFSNSEIHDTTRRVAFDGSSRQPGFLLPSVRDGLRNGGAVTGLAFASAIWAKYCRGRREDGAEIKANDPNWAQLNEIAMAAMDDPMKWLGMSHIYGDLKHSEDFSGRFVLWSRELDRVGVRAAIESYLSEVN